MKTLYFETYHTDLIGGGGLALYNLATALQNFYDVHLAQPWDPGMEKYEFLRSPVRPFKVGKPDKIDLFVASKYGVYVPPIPGALNFFYCLYPRQNWDMSGYQKILTISRYSELAIRERWGRASEILIGGAFAPDYRPQFPKEDLFLNCARFFQEENGHSKNQHILIEAFRNTTCLQTYRLVLAGSVILPSDRAYLDRCRALADGDPRISFVTLPTREVLRDLYAKAKCYVHAMGYQREDPAETEHYGISVEKAKLSGCYSLVHASGGAPEFSGGSWRTPEELSGMMVYGAYHEHDYHPREIAAVYSSRTWEAFVEKTKRVFELPW